MEALKPQAVQGPFKPTAKGEALMGPPFLQVAAAYPGKQQVVVCTSAGPPAVGCPLAPSPLPTLV